MTIQNAAVSSGSAAALDQRREHGHLLFGGLADADDRAGNFAAAQ
jgi:hypothetical protein